MYGQLGDAVDSEGEEELDQVMNMRSESAMPSSSMMMLGSAPAQSKQKSVKRGSATNTVGGKKKLNDQVSSKLYKLSKY